MKKKNPKKKLVYTGPGILLPGTKQHDDYFILNRPFSKMTKKEKAKYRSSKRSRQIDKKNEIEAEKLRRVRKISANLTPSAPTVDIAGIGVKQPAKSMRGSFSNRKRTEKDALSYRDAALLNEKIAELKKKREEDPNEFDRQAMK